MLFHAFGIKADILNNKSSALSWVFAKAVMEQPKIIFAELMTPFDKKKIQFIKSIKEAERANMPPLIVATNFAEQLNGANVNMFIQWPIIKAHLTSAIFSAI